MANCLTENGQAEMEREFEYNLGAVGIEELFGQADVVSKKTPSLALAMRIPKVKAELENITKLLTQASKLESNSVSIRATAGHLSLFLSA